MLGWLHDAAGPALRRLVRRHLLDEPDKTTPDELAGDPWVRPLLADQRPDGGFGGRAYAKWGGSFWRSATLSELEVGPDVPGVRAAATDACRWVLRNRPRTVAGRVRRCASQEGTVLRVCSGLGLAHEPEVAGVAAHLVEWQWPDGGWNCDVRPAARHSSFHETHGPLWGLSAYALATGDEDAAAAADSAAELLLDHGVHLSRRTGEPAHPSWAVLHHPPYWHYDVLQGLLVLMHAGRMPDERTTAALDLVEERRARDGRWRAGASWWRPPGSERAAEVVDWGRSGPSPMLTYKALRVLRTAGR